MLTVNILKEKEQTVLQLVGLLESNSAVQLEDAVAKVLNENVTNVCLDLEKLEYTSSKGLRIILSLQKGLQAKGGNLTLRHIQPAVKEVFEVTGFTDFMDIE